MSEDVEDVVAQLKDLQDGFREFSPEMEVLQRAIDEIVALRVERDRLGQFVDGVKHHVAQARDEALEAAARRCDRLATDYTIPVSVDNWSAGCRGCAGRIRALKGKQQ